MPRRPRLHSDYHWSSHGAYAGGPRPTWLAVDRILSPFGSTAAAGHTAYAKFMQDLRDNDIWQSLRTGCAEDRRVLDDVDFTRSVTTEGLAIAPSRLTLDDLVRAACRQHRVSEAELVTPSHSRSLARIRAEIGRAGIDGRVSTLAAVARRFGRSPSGLCRSVGRLTVRRLNGQ